MNYKFYKTDKIKSGRPRCVFRQNAVTNQLPTYVDAHGIARLTASGNRIEGRKELQTMKRRARGIQPPVLKATPEVIAAKNRANVKRWKAENPVKLNALRAKGNFIRRSAVRGRTMEPITAEFLTAQRELQNDCCAYCATPLFGAGHQDHITPVAKGGAHAPFNIAWACEPCNLRKGARLGWVPFWRVK